MKIIKFLRIHWLFILILSIGFFVRIWNIEGLTTFSGDQGRDFLEVKKILDGNLTLLGPRLGPSNSFGNVYLGPAYYYMLTPIFWLFNFNPLGPSYLMLTFAISTLILIYIIGLKFISKNVAIISSILWAFNTELIEQSRVALNPFPIPFFAILTLLSILEIVKSKSKQAIWYLVIGISCGILFQLHYLTIPFICITFVSLACFKKFKQLIFSILFFVLTISPQILFELKHNFFITSQIIRQISSSQEISYGTHFKTQLLSSLQILTSTFVGIQTSAFIICIVFIAIVLLIFIKKKSLRFIIGLLTTNILFSIIAASFYPLTIQLHYFATVYPAIILLISISTVLIFENLNNILLKTILIILFVQIITTYALNINLSRQEGYTMPSGWNLIGQKKASDIIVSDPDSSKIFNVASALDGDTRNMPLRYLVTIHKKYPQDVEHYPDSEVLYLTSRDDEEAIKSYTVWEVSSFQPFYILKLAEVQNGISVFKLTKDE